MQILKIYTVKLGIVLLILFWVVLSGCISTKQDTNNSIGVEESKEIEPNNTQIRSIQEIKAKDIGHEDTEITNTSNLSNLDNSNLDNGSANNITKPEYIPCLSSYGIKNNTIIFYYADWCAYSQKMKPWVQELEKSGYNFFWALSTNETAKQIMKECLSNITDIKYVPEFICPKTNKSHVGKFSAIEEMKYFVSDCRR